MKKMIALLLVFAMCTALCGCIDLSQLFAGSESKNERNETNELFEKYEDLIYMMEDGAYDAAHAYIDEMAHSESMDATIAPPMEEMPEIVETLPAEEEVEEQVPAVNTDGLLSYVEITTIDNLGNQNSSKEEFFTYDAQGRIYETDSVELQEYYGFEFGTFVPHFRFEYDDADIVSKITVMYHDDIDALLTPTYDANGNLISTHIITNTAEYTVHFTYDANGNRLTGDRFDQWYETVETFTYTYDSNGRLLQSTHIDETPWDYVIVTDYFYDAEGRLIQSVENWSQSTFGYKAWHITNVYTYDSNGKLLSYSITSDAEGCDYAEKIVTYHYGNN